MDCRWQAMLSIVCLNISIIFCTMRFFFYFTLFWCDKVKRIRYQNIFHPKVYFKNIAFLKQVWVELLYLFLFLQVTCQFTSAICFTILWRLWCHCHLIFMPLNKEYEKGFNNKVDNHGSLNTYFSIPIQIWIEFLFHTIISSET